MNFFLMGLLDKSGDVERYSAELMHLFVNDYVDKSLHYL